jgi:hypothetical protein
MEHARITRKPRETAAACSQGGRQVLYFMQDGDQPQVRLKIVGGELNAAGERGGGGPVLKRVPARAQKKPAVRLGGVSGDLFF